MSCIWIGLINALKLKITANDLLLYLQKNNKETKNVLWNGQCLTTKEHKESISRIKSINSVNEEYDCSACDPLLLLIAELYNVSIIHNYNNSIIKYENIDYPNKYIIVYSNFFHFWSS